MCAARCPDWNGTSGTPMPIPLQKGRLGRGLASLIGEIAAGRVAAARARRAAAAVRSTSCIPSGHNPRKSFADAELDRARRIRSAARGCCSRSSRGPTACAAATRSSPASAAGARRRRPACTTVPVIVRELSDQEAAEFALIENVQRTDLNPIEEATGYSELIEQVRLHPGAGGRGDRQEPQPSRQHPAPAAAAGVRAGPACRTAS